MIIIQLRVLMCTEHLKQKKIGLEIGDVPSNTFKYHETLNLCAALSTQRITATPNHQSILIIIPSSMIGYLKPLPTK